MKKAITLIGIQVPKTSIQKEQKYNAEENVLYAPGSTFRASEFEHDPDHIYIPLYLQEASEQKPSSLANPSPNLENIHDELHDELGGFDFWLDSRFGLWTMLVNQ